jgi:hypothetical protein
MDIFDNQQERLSLRLLREKPRQCRKATAFLLLRVQRDRRRGGVRQEVGQQRRKLATEGRQFVWTLPKVCAKQVEERRVGAQLVLGKAVGVEQRPSLRLGEVRQLRVRDASS